MSDFVQIAHFSRPVLFNFFLLLLLSLLFLLPVIANVFRSVGSSGTYLYPVNVITSTFCIIVHTSYVELLVCVLEEHVTLIVSYALEHCTRFSVINSCLIFVTLHVLLQTAVW